MQILHIAWTTLGDVPAALSRCFQTMACYTLTEVGTVTGTSAFLFFFHKISGGPLLINMNNIYKKTNEFQKLQRYSSHCVLTSVSCSLCPMRESDSPRSCRWAAASIGSTSGTRMVREARLGLVKPVPVPTTLLEPWKEKEKTQEQGCLIEDTGLINNKQSQYSLLPGKV